MTTPRPCPIGCHQRCPRGEPCFFEGCDDTDLLLERKLARDQERFRGIVLEHGGPEILAEHDARMRDLRLGITGARSAWHSISDPQRAAVEVLGSGAALVRAGTTFAASRAGGPHQGRAFRLATVRNLASRELAAWDGGALDPEARVVATERGNFVLKHGRPSA